MMIFDENHRKTRRSSNGRTRGVARLRYTARNATYSKPDGFQNFFFAFP
jgi:hypothetical protein